MSTELPRIPTPSVAAAQQGVFTAVQAMAEGFTRAQVRYRLGKGAWRVVAGRGLVADTAGVGIVQGAWAAALTWPEAVVWGPSAVQLRYPQAPLPRTGAVHCATPRNHRPLPGLATHRMSLPRAEVATGEGPAVQVADAALVDTLAILPTAQADSLFAWVVTRKALGAERFAELLGRRLGARGTAKLREVYLKWLVHGAASGFEFDLRGVLEASGLGGFKANAPIAVPGFGTVVADFYYPEAKLIVEADGRGTHAGQAAFEADRARDMALIAAGFKVIRVTWRGLRDNPAKVVQAVAAAVRPEP